LLKTISSEGVIDSKGIKLDMEGEEEVSPEAAFD
jgi:hypothetical protein